MADVSTTFDIKLNAKDYSTEDTFLPYTGVVIWLSEDAAQKFTQEEIDSADGALIQAVNGEPTIFGYKSTVYGTNGRVLECINPFGSIEMADNILNAMVYNEGVAYTYEPFEATALIPPHFEIGDGVLINNEHHGIYGYERTASRLPQSKIEAPADEEIDHEYGYVPSRERTITRKFADVDTQFSIQNGLIMARVTQTEFDRTVNEMQSTISQTAEEINANVVKKVGGDNSSFGWSLTADGFVVYSNNTPMMTIDSNGATFKGAIEAETGHIGGANGFTITSGKLYSSTKSSFSSTNNGVYIGTDGISLGAFSDGKNPFQVTPSGTLYARSATFENCSVSGAFSGTGTFKSGTSGFFNATSGSTLQVAGTGIQQYVGNIVASSITADTINAVYAGTKALNAKYAEIDAKLTVEDFVLVDDFTYKGYAMGLVSLSPYTSFTRQYLYVSIPASVAADGKSHTIKVSGSSSASVGGTGVVTALSSKSIQYVGR